MAKQFANSGDPENVASDVSLHCRLITLFGGLQTKMGYFVMFTVWKVEHPGLK